MSAVLYIVATILLCMVSRGVEGLYCFRCLSLDCPEDAPECQPIRSFIQEELRNFYYFDKYIVPCPKLNDTSGWRLMQINEEDPCPEEKPKEATCTLGRMQVKTIQRNAAGVKVSEKVNYATILGCANRPLLSRIKNAFNEGRCDLALRNKSSSGTGNSRELQIEHCRDISTQCHEDDFCIDWKKSEIRPWADTTRSKQFDFTLIMGILAVVVVGMSALLIAGLLRDPPHIPSQLPRTIGDESESAKVLGFRDISPVEVDDGMNTISSKRPSVPPPPPPRLHKPFARDGTPV